MKMTSLSTGGESARLGGAFGEAWAYGGKNWICAVAAVIGGLSAFMNATAGTIGGTNADWTRWQEVAGLPAARDYLAAGVLNGALYAVGGENGGGRAERRAVCRRRE